MSTSIEDYFSTLPDEKRDRMARRLELFMTDPDAFSVVHQLIAGLNPEQLEVVVHPVEGEPILVLGGAGSGKTATLTRRLVFLILSGVPADRIFAVTFTRKAAREMAERTREILHQLRARARPPYDAWLEAVALEVESAWITTFHSAGLRILRDSPDGVTSNLVRLGYGEHSRIVDEQERNVILSEILRDYESEEVRVEVIAGIVSNAKGAFVFPEGFHHTVKTRIDEIASLVYPRYQQVLERRGLLDFDDLIFKVYELFERHPEILDFYQEKFQSLLIDEYQDTNLSQYLIGMMLAKKHKRIMAVGDDDQSIYGWRGAEVTNLSRFLSDYPQVRIVKLVRNYRSDATILAAANAIWKDKPEELRKVLVCAKDGGTESTERVRVVAAETERDEADYIAGEAIRALDEGIPAREIAVLVRAHHLLGPIVNALEENGLPWAQAGSIKSLARPEVQGTIALMEVAALSARRISSRDAWHAGDSESLNHALEQALAGPAYACDASVVADLHQVPDPGSLVLDDAERDRCRRFFDRRLSYALDHVASFARQALLDASAWRPSVLLERALATAPPTAASDEADPAVRAIKRLRDLAAISDLRRVAVPAEGILLFTEEVNARAGIAPDEGDSTEADLHATPAIQLMTLHAAKGLEFDVVFLAAMEDGLIPVRRRETGESMPEEDRLAEEKRLFYVGVSRARRRLYLTRARRRAVGSGERECSPTPYLALIPEELTLPVWI